jgi:hypothetical protein
MKYRQVTLCVGIEEWITGDSRLRFLVSDWIGDGVFC